MLAEKSREITRCGAHLGPLMGAPPILHAYFKKRVALLFLGGTPHICLLIVGPMCDGKNKC